MKINLINRDNKNLWLEKEETGLWKLCSSSPDYIFKYMRICNNNNGEIIFIDPPGGPLMTIGDVIDGRVILNIDKDFKFTLSETNNLIFDNKCNNWTAYYQGSIKKFKKWLIDVGFIDADILNPFWYVFENEVYKLPIDWKKSLLENEWVVLDFVGHIFHVIPKEDLTDSQYWFIKSILNK